MEEEKMIDENWFGPWYSYSADVVKGGTVIVDEIFEYRRHVYVNGEFRTEKIPIEKWWELGYKYRHLPEGEIK